MWYSFCENQSGNICFPDIYKNPHTCKTYKIEGNYLNHLFVWLQLSSLSHPCCKNFSYFFKTKILERVTQSLLQVLLKAISNHLKDVILMNDVMMTFWKRPAGNMLKMLVSWRDCKYQETKGKRELNFGAYKICKDINTSGSKISRYVYCKPNVLLIISLEA